MNQPAALVLLLLSASALVNTKRCHREPHSDVTAAIKTPGDNGFRIDIGGDPEYYVPGTVYTVSVLGSRTHTRLQTFLRFMLSVEATGTTTVSGHSRRGRSDPWSPQRAGRFQLFGDSLTAFNEQCVNTVLEAEPALAKTEVQVMWTAPRAGSGCVIFKAMVMEDENNWYMDDGALSLSLCEQQETRADSSSHCCACDEAKYQVMFEGIWSPETHPKDFPNNQWLTHFSDVIGASHKVGFHVWREGVVATEGLRQLAEWGAPRTMEKELDHKKHHIRTILKAAGLWYPRVNANTSSTFRVDKNHPLISLVSMLGPSPDWIVGVSGHNLCLPNCTWIPHQIIDLLPYDAGTDNGITYMSPNEPTIPAQPVRRISRSWPADEQAPFYDPRPEAPPIPPLARLYIKRQDVIHRPCDYTGPLGDNDDHLLEATIAENSEDSDRPECQVTEWRDWSLCSVTCGKGLRMRTREYINEPKAQMMGCDRQLIAKEMCAAEIPTCIDSENDVCGVTEWGPWSECSVMCGKGVAMKTRHFLNRMGFKKCPHVSLVEKEECDGVKGPCDETECHVTMWSEWSPCSASCGEGRRGRTRFFLGPGLMPPKHCQFEQWSPCMLRDCYIAKDTAKEICSLESDSGVCRGYYPRWFFNSSSGECEKFTYGGCRGNQNNFDSPERCEEVCGPVKVLLKGLMVRPEEQSSTHESKPTALDCMLSPWSEWTPCSVSCGSGHRERVRMIKAEPQNGGKPCPKKLSRRKKCNLHHCTQN